MAIPVTGSLFGDDDPALSLVPAPAQRRPANREQRQFERLVAQIELKRAQLKEWQAYSLRYNQRVLDELEPLRAQLRAAQRQLVGIIDEQLARPSERRPLGRVQRLKLRALLLNLLEGLLTDTRDAALEEIFDRYSDVSRDETLQAEMQSTQTFLEEVMGLDIDAEHGASTPEELLDYAQQKLHERASAKEGEAHERTHQRGAGRGRSGGAKSQADEARRAQAAKEVKQSLREVFRKLVSVLHPDRELDPQVRLRKTELMQRVNQAYEANDLLTLLGLQLEIEQINTADLAALSPERLKHYIQILRDQLSEIDLELESCIAPYRETLQRPLGRSVLISDVEHDLSAARARLATAVRELRADLVAFRDPERLRQILKHVEFESEPDELDDLDEFADVFQVPRTPRRRRR